MKTSVKTRWINNARTRQGYALVSVLVIGLTSILFLLGIAEIATLSLHSESKRRFAIELRSAAEAGLDYAVSQYNQSAKTQTTCILDPPPSQAALTTPNFMPTSLLAGAAGGANNDSTIAQLQMSITVSRVWPSNAWSDIATWSSIYSPSTDFTKSSSTTNNAPPTTNVKIDSWRILTVTAKYASISKSIRVILQPHYGQTPDNQTPPGTAQSYFNNVLFGNQQLFFSPPSNTALIVQGTGPPNTPYNPAVPSIDTQGQSPTNQAYTYQLSVTTNEYINVGAQTDIKGNVQISSVNSGNNVTANLGDGLVEGKIVGNGQFSGVTSTPGSSPANTDNVLANADLYNGATNPSGNPNKPYLVMRQSTGNPLSSNATPSIPSINQQLSQITPAPAQYGSASANPLPSLTNTAALTAGDYTASGLDTTGVTQPVQVGTSNGSTPTRIFIQDGASNTAAVNLSSSQFVNASADASNLQLWYSGTKPINIQLTGGIDFRGLVYAPNSNVTTTGSGTFNGAIVAQKIYVNHQGYLNLRTDLSSASSTNSAKGLVNISSVSAGTVATFYTPVTWQELSD